MKKFLALTFVALVASVLCFTACAPLDPKADPLVVRTEQVQLISEGGLDFIIATDQLDRGFWRTNAPAFHKFCEYLREKLPAAGLPDGRTNLQRYLLSQWELDQAKLAYKGAKSAATSNALRSAQISLKALEDQTAAWLTIITNRPPN